MDAAEIARQFAAKYHRDAVAGGLDPWKPYAFAIAEARRRDIDVELSLPGGSILGNSRAVYIQADQLIVHENVGTDYEKAFLVAHEIGHSELGDDPEVDELVQIDPVRTAEACPIGLDRVVDYGRRQRREVQMDLFAREFLLPREFVRKLHLEDNLTATDIADRMGAPFEVVAQQLFDALLLPVIEASQLHSSIVEPDKHQVEAINHRGAAYLLEAGPGTGKTQTLTARVDSLLKEGIDPRKILLLTFSNKAAAEMSDRIALSNKEAAAAIWIGTFHAFGLDIIRRFYFELGIPKDPRLLDRAEAVELLENIFPSLGLLHYRDFYDPTESIADILNAISRAKDEVVDEVKYAELAQAMIENAINEEERVRGEKALEVASVFGAYERLKKEKGCVDFGDLVSLPVKLLESNSEIRDCLQNTYEHVLVDEYQDVNRSSIRLLVALRGSGQNLWAVGDAKQSIYRFRGASSFNMGRFGKEDFLGGKRGRLKKNFRSVKEVVDLFSKFAVGMKVGDLQSGLESHRGAHGASPTLFTVQKADDQTVVIADKIEAMRAAGIRYRDQVVLCTGNEKLSELGQNLERLGVPVLFLGSLFERPEVRDLFAILGTLVDRRATGLTRIACSPEFEMSIADVAKVLDFYRTNEIQGKWIQEAHEVAELTSNGVAALRKLGNALRGFDEKSQPWDVIAKFLLDRTKIAAGIAQSDNLTDRTRGIAIWQLMSFLRAQPAGAGLPIMRIMNRVRRLLRLGDEKDLRQLPSAAQGIDAVRLMTIHGAKGLEFKVVHLPNFNQSTVPRSPQASPCPPPNNMVEGSGPGSSLDTLKTGHEEEQECLFYVAMSRAKDLFFAYATTKKSNGQNWSLSPYLDRLMGVITQSKASPTRELPPPPEGLPILLAIEGGFSLQDGQMKLYEKCPRRFFYTHILQIGGRRSSTGFMQMHDAVRDVYKAVIDGTFAINTGEQLNQKLSETFALHGLANHGYLEEYRKIGLAMLQFFRSTRNGSAEKPTALSLAFDNDRILVMADDVVLNPDGQYTFRRIKTGHHRASHAEDVDSAALVIAVKQSFPNAVVELLYLSDQKHSAIKMSIKQLENRKEKIATYLKAIRSGDFPMKASSRTCPGCPAFFVCGTTPQGTLQKKF